MHAPSLPTALFAALLSAAAVALVGLNATGAGQDALMRRQHVRPTSAAQWVALQPLPGMYTLANRAWSSDRDVPCADLDAEATSLGYVNHYPTRLVTFETSRHAWGVPGGPSRLYVESRVRGRVLRSLYRVERAGGRLSMTRATSGAGCRS